MAYPGTPEMLQAEMPTWHNRARIVIPCCNYDQAQRIVEKLTACNEFAFDVERFVALEVGGVIVSEGVVWREKHLPSLEVPIEPE